MEHIGSDEEPELEPEPEHEINSGDEESEHDRLLGHFVGPNSGMLMSIIDGDINTPEHIASNILHTFIDQHSSNSNNSKLGMPRGASIISTTRSSDGKVSINITYDEHCYSCCVCFEFIVGKIINCDNGHALCNTCDTEIMKSDNDKCPVCKSVTRLSNTVLENGIKTILVACPHRENGCEQRIYPDDVDEHTTTCEYSNIKCPWCEGSTSPRNLQSHTETECKYPFVSMNCSNRINFIKAKSIKYAILVSSVEESRILYIAKINNICHLLCVQMSSNDEQIDDIMITYSIKAKSPTTESHSEKLIMYLRIHKPDHLINGQAVTSKIPMDELDTYENIIITDFSDTLSVGCYLMVADRLGEWHRAVITRRSYHTDTITFTYTIHNHVVVDSIFLNNGTSHRIRPADYNGGRTTAEDNVYINNLFISEQYALAVERSGGNT